MRAVTGVHRRDELAQRFYRTAFKTIKLNLSGTLNTDDYGDRVESVTEKKNTGEYDADGVFIYIGMLPSTSPFSED